MISWNKSSAPEWFSDELRARTEDLANQAAPCEVAGFFCEVDGQIVIRQPKVAASRRSFQAARNDVIEFAFEMRRLEATIVASFHSHPTGERAMSIADEQLTAWTDMHLLLAAAGVTWTSLWYQSQEQ